MTQPTHNILIVDASEAGQRLAQRCADAGFDVRLAVSAEDALDKIIEVTPELAIVELHLPDAPGTDLATLLRGDVKVPIFLASAARLPAGDDELDALLMDAQGLIAKPYQFEDVLQQIATTLHLDLDHLKGAAGACVDAKGQRWGHEDVADEPIVILDDVVEDDPVSEPVEAELDAAIDATAAQQTALDLVEIWQRKVATYREQKPDSPAPQLETTSGSLAQTPVIELFDAFYRSTRSGELGLNRGRAKRLIVFKDGNPIYARSNIARERLGTQLVELGLITGGQLREALFEAGGQDKRVGEVLVRQGLITDDNRRRVVARLVSHIVLASCAWREGSYHIGVIDRGHTEPQHVPLFIGNVILRAVMLTASEETVRAAIPLDGRFAPGAESAYPMERLRLDAEEAHLVLAADGTKTVADLLTLYELPTLKTLKFFHALRRLDVIRQVGTGAARPREITFF